MAKVVCNFLSYSLNRAVDITVVLPSVTCPEALGMGNGPVTHALPAKFPVVYLLHGFANNHAQWTGYTNVELYAEERRIAIVNISAENKAYAKVGADDFKRFVSEELPEFLTKNHERFRGDTKKQPATIRVQEGAAGTHAGINFTSRLLDFQDAVLITTDDGFNIMYRQFSHISNTFDLQKYGLFPSNAKILCGL